MEQKTCKQCLNEFGVGDWDLEFLKKISPTFAGKAFEIPEPSLCPECRRQKRLMWRNNRSLYNRKCDLCSKPIITTFSPDKPFTVYCQDCWWSDKWDPKSFGLDYDFNKTFSDQFAQLIKKVPRIALMNKNSENSEYCHFSGNNKDCYLCFAGSWNNENCSYGYRFGSCKDCFDCHFLEKSELCYQIFYGAKNFKSAYCEYIYDSNECYFSYDLKGCDHCVFSSGLRNKSYFAYNKPCTKEEFLDLKKTLEKNSTVSESLKKFNEVKKSAVKNAVVQLKCEDCEGANLNNCKGLREAFEINDMENGKYVLIGALSNDVMDCTAVGLGETELCYYSMSVGDTAYNCLFSNGIWSCRNIFYSDSLINCEDCFGSVSMKKQNHCILNKKYSNQEYEQMVGKIIGHMKSTGEWGEFLENQLCPYAYNETFANEFYPLSKEEAEKIGCGWQENDYTPNYQGEYCLLNDDINYYQSREKVDEIMRGIIKCEKSGKPFKIMPNELAFHVKEKIALPLTHPNVRFEERFAKLNFPKLYDSECICSEQGHGHDGVCQNKFKTTFAPERKEKVYCQDCYERSLK